jgi:hypothetical protein
MRNSAMGHISRGALIAVLALAGCNTEPPAPRERPTLNAAAQKSATQITVTNEDTVAWSACRVEINSRWTAQMGDLAPGERATAGLMTFTRSGGERFNPSTHAVENLTVRCTTPAGALSWFGRF